MARRIFINVEISNYGRDRETREELNPSGELRDSELRFKVSWELRRTKIRIVYPSPGLRPPPPLQGGGQMAKKKGGDR